MYRLELTQQEAEELVESMGYFRRILRDVRVTSIADSLRSLLVKIQALQKQLDKEQI